MDGKLTLKIDQKIIDHAREYASNQGRSLSRIVEAYLCSLVAGMKHEEMEISLFVKSMVVKAKFPEGEVSTQEYYDWLIEKHK